MSRGGANRCCCPGSRRSPRRSDASCRPGSPRVSPVGNDVRDRGYCRPGVGQPAALRHPHRPAAPWAGCGGIATSENGAFTGGAATGWCGTCSMPATCSPCGGRWGSATCATRPQAGRRLRRRSPSTSTPPTGSRLLTTEISSTRRSSARPRAHRSPHLNTDSDSEVLLNVFAHELQARGSARIGEEEIFRAVSGVHRRCVGGYAAVALVFGFGLVAFRDPRGIRPLALGSRGGPHGTEYMVASESVALSAVGFEFQRDVEPGEAICVREGGELSVRQCAESRPDRLAYSSTCTSPARFGAGRDLGLPARLRMGERLRRRSCARLRTTGSTW